MVQKAVKKMKAAIEKVREILDETGCSELEKMLLVVEQRGKKVTVLPYVHLRANQGMGITTFGKFYTELIKQGKVFGSRDVKYLGVKLSVQCSSTGL